ncbi:hypothetical protein B0H34DRAFT_270744 [Crassisporium funariophilum]|nr:hypothetical protein B0H34DRAFT_270744 [Crassisporium funariophilum]
MRCSLYVRYSSFVYKVHYLKVGPTCDTFWQLTTPQPYHTFRTPQSFPNIKMVYIARTAQIIVAAALLMKVPQSVFGATIGNCHPYPGADASDCLKLISDNLSNEEVLDCSKAPVILNYQTCSIVTRCTQGKATLTKDDAVRRTLTVIGGCALSDRGSISGNYLADDGAKTCYLYVGRENFC